MHITLFIERNKNNKKGVYKIYLNVNVKVADNFKNLVNVVSEKKLALFDKTWSLQFWVEAYQLMPYVVAIRLKLRSGKFFHGLSFTLKELRKRLPNKRFI